MRDYRSIMEQVRLSDEKKEEILTMLENQNTNTKKYRMPKVGKVVLAAALAVGCVLSIAAGLPAQVYNFMSGGSMTVLPGTNEVYLEAGFTGAEEDAPVRAENDRLWLAADGQKLDITDQVDENTPYIHEHTDPATGNKGYLIAGGTPEDFGWVEIVQFEIDGSIAMSGNNYDTVSIAELYEAQKAQKEANGGTFEMVDPGSHRPWLQAAIDQLGLDI